MNTCHNISYHWPCIQGWNCPKKLTVVFFFFFLDPVFFTIISNATYIWEPMVKVTITCPNSLIKMYLVLSLSSSGEGKCSQGIWKFTENPYIRRYQLFLSNESLLLLLIFVGTSSFQQVWRRPSDHELPPDQCCEQWWDEDQVECLLRLSQCSEERMLHWYSWLEALCGKYTKKVV